MAEEAGCGLHFGEEIRSLRAGAVRLAEARYESNGHIPPHAHEVPLLCLVLEGGYVEEVGGSRLDCGTTTVSYHAADVVHSNRFSDRGARCLNLGLDLEALGLEEVARRLGAAPVVHRRMPGGLALRLTAELEVRDDLSPLAVEGLVTTLLCDLARGPRTVTVRGPPGWLEHVHQRLREEFAAAPTLVELADEAGVHRTHLARAFRRHFGCTVGEFVRRRRVEFACRQLRDTDLSLSRVAYAAGFADQSHMTRTFGRLLGTTPGRYRDSAGS